MASPRARKATAKALGYQFKITLVHSAPEVWRRILVPGGTLDDLHEHIQTAMGWENAHLHQFKVRGKRYGNPELLDDGFRDDVTIDSLEVMLEDLFGKLRPLRKLTYEYDFGDGWMHEIDFEGMEEAPKGKKLPCCLEGESACPPEDIGGVWGYPEFLLAINDPDHEEHELYAEWARGFDPEKFSIASATRAMREGLPSWDD